MNRTRPRLLPACLLLALSVVLVGCGNKGPLVQAGPVPATIDGTPTMAEPEGTDPTDEVSLPEDTTTPTEPVDPTTPETEPVPEPTPDPQPPAEDPNG